MNARLISPGDEAQRCVLHHWDRRQHIGEGPEPDGEIARRRWAGGEALKYVTKRNRVRIACGEIEGRGAADGAETRRPNKIQAVACGVVDAGEETRIEDADD